MERVSGYQGLWLFKDLCIICISSWHSEWWDFIINTATFSFEVQKYAQRDIAAETDRQSEGAASAGPISLHAVNCLNHSCFFFLMTADVTCRLSGRSSSTCRHISGCVFGKKPFQEMILIKSSVCTRSWRTGALIFIKVQLL